MSEHPPIPDEFKELFWKKMSGQSFNHSTIYAINEWIVEGAAILWREWTRGMAVVPLPEEDGTDDDGHPVWLVASELGGDSLTAIDGGFGPPFVVVSSTSEMVPVKSARRRAAAYLAAADGAEQLASEANAEAVNQP